MEWAIVYWNAEDKPRLCRIIVNSDERGKGFGKQIVLSLLELTFANTAVKEVSLNVYSFNTSAIKYYEQCGFKISSNQSIAERAGWKDWKAPTYEGRAGGIRDLAKASRPGQETILKRNHQCYFL